MSNLFLILVIAFVVIVFAIALLATGWLITGKTKVCSLNPDQKKEDQSFSHDGSSPNHSSPQPEKNNLSKTFKN